ncbi:FAD-dependent monooxygenase, partial [Streptomyces sp. NPDC127110]|uniref:FAD-dependent monooxygenase n=1 Tax=Streptomyces sp. NPDC127110 TaxID=3345362 RepID=UPI003634E5AD
MPTPKTVLISGASIAGPALAHWLARHGFHPTVIEIAPAPRPGGRAVDFRGETHLHVLDRMGILDELRRVRTGGTPITFVDADDRELLHLPAAFAGGDVEVLHGDLSRILHEASRASAEYVFGDTVTSLTETPAGVDVTFRHAPPRTFDIVIGADGLHSTVRRLAFGPEQRYVSHLGYYAATWSLPGDPHPTRPGSVGFNAPGRLASVAAPPAADGRAGAFFLFASPELPYDRNDPAAHKALITRAFAGLPWRVGPLLDSLAAADDLYFDSISRADVDTWSTGRTALLGDAACGATIGGMGTGTAVVAAYVLAAELARTPEDPRSAFRRYESLVRPYARACQRGGDRTGPFLAPATTLGLRLRNTLLNQPRALAWLLKQGRTTATPPPRRRPPPAGRRWGASRWGAGPRPPPRHQRN